MFQLIEIAYAGGVITDATPISQVGINILNFLLSVAGIIAIISLVIASLRYFIAAGDEKEMLKAKRAFQISVIGIVMAMSAMILVKLVGQFFK